MKFFKFCKTEYLNKEDILNSDFVELDKITGGWKKGELIIIGGRPAMGKTGLAISMARNLSIHGDVPVAFFSLEMSAKQLAQRFLSNISNLEAKKLMPANRGELSEAELSLLNKTKKQLESAPIYLDDTPSLSIDELRKKASYLVREYQVKLIIIDYLQLMNTGGMSPRNREDEVSMITRSLKALAKELNIPIVALSQLNRSIATKDTIESKQPQLSDLRESGSIEQDADMVCFIHRPEYYKIYEDGCGNNLRGKAKIIVAKNRNGERGDALLRFCQESVSFQNIEEKVS